MIVEIVGFLTSVSFAIVAGEFLVQVDTLRPTRTAVLLTLSERASIRRNAGHLVGRIGLYWLLACRDHVAAHVQSVVVSPVFRRSNALIRWVGLLDQGSVFHSFFGVDGYRRRLRRLLLLLLLRLLLLDARAPLVQTLMKNFPLMAEVSTTRLVCLR